MNQANSRAEDDAANAGDPQEATDAGSRARLGVGNRTRVRTEFSQERMLRAYVDLFEEACASRP